MAIKNKSRKPYIIDNDTNIKVGIDLPIRRDDGEDGYFATTSTTIEAVKNNIKNLLQTSQGERFFQPQLGLNLKRLLFEHVNEENLVGIQNAILDKFEQWLPFVEVRDIQIVDTPTGAGAGDSEVRINIIFNISQDPNTLDSVSLNFSADINEQL